MSEYQNWQKEHRHALKLNETLGAEPNAAQDGTAVQVDRRADRHTMRRVQSADRHTMRRVQSADRHTMCRVQSVAEVERSVRRLTELCRHGARPHPPPASCHGPRSRVTPSSPSSICRDTPHPPAWGGGGGCCCRISINPGSPRLVCHLVPAIQWMNIA